MTVSPRILDEVYAALPEKRCSVMLFGSVARGEMKGGSDIDVLVLRDNRPGVIRSGRVNISCYTPKQLQKMAEEGSLFVKHLIMDGVTLEDPASLLAGCLKLYCKPTSYSGLARAFSEAMPLFDHEVISSEIVRNSCTEVAVFCLRTLIYAKADDLGKLSFSLEKLRDSLGWAEIDLLLNIKQNHRFSSIDGLREIARKLELWTGAPAKNPYGTIQAFITNLSTKNPLIKNLGLRILSGESMPNTYDSLSNFLITS